MTRVHNRGQKSQAGFADGGKTTSDLQGKSNSLTQLGLGRANGGSTKSEDGFGNPNVLKEAKRSKNIGVIDSKASKSSMGDAHGGAIKAKTGRKDVKRASGGSVSDSNDVKEYGNPNVLKEGKRKAAFNAYSSAGGPSDGKGLKTGGKC